MSRALILLAAFVAVLVSGRSFYNYCDEKSFVFFDFENNLIDASCTRAWMGGRIGFSNSTMGLTSANFDNQSYLLLPIIKNIFAQQSINEFSISMFFKTDEMEKISVLFDNSGETEKDKHTIQLTIEPAIGSIVGRAVVSGWIFHSQQLSVHANFMNFDKKWNHVAFIFKNGVLSLVINGNTKRKVDAGFPSSKGRYTIDDVSAPLSFGSKYSDGNQFTGKMDNIRIFKRALTMTEVEDLAKGTF